MTYKLLKFQLLRLSITLKLFIFLYKYLLALFDFAHLLCLLKLLIKIDGWQMTILLEFVVEVLLHLQHMPFMVFYGFFRLEVASKVQRIAELLFLEEKSLVG